MTTGAIVLVLLAIAAAFIAAGVLVEARRVLSWVVACAVVAALIELAINWLDRWVRRTVAIILVLATLAAVAGTLVFGVFHDLDVEVRRLQTEAPIAAQRIEESQRLGNLASEVDLDRRVTEAVRQLNSPSSGLAGQAVTSVGTYLVCSVLTILFLSWGPRIARATLGQLEQSSADRVSVIAQTAFARARRYVALSILQAVVVGFVGWFICLWLDLPAPAPLALALAAFSLVPNLGILLGGLPILLLAGGLEPMRNVLLVTAIFIALEVFSTMYVQVKIVKSSGLYVGPAIIVVAALIGFELYGIGGALYGTALTVLGVAVIDATEDTPSTSHT